MKTENLIIMDELNKLTVNLSRNLAIFHIMKLNKRQLRDIFEINSDKIIGLVFKELGQTEQVEQTTSKLMEDVIESVSPNNLLQLLLEMVLSRSAEDFDRYLTQMLKRAFIERPEILRASENKILVSEVLQCASIDEVILKVTESKVQTLGYKGLKDTIKYLNSELGLNFNVQIPEFLEACEIFQVRNIIVHNAGIINETFLQNTGRKDLKAGIRFPLTEKYVNNACLKLVYIGEALDRQFKSHFQIN